MARTYHYDDSAQALYRPAEAPPFFEEWTDEDTANHDLLCAEMSRLAYAGQPQVTAALKPRGFALRHWMGGETLRERADSLGTDGFVAVNEAAGLTVLAFRGTEANKPEDLIADGFIVSEPWMNGGKVHRGFARCYAAVREGINGRLTPPGGTLLITGHSLGAALATLAAAEHAAREPKLITFGSPRVGDAVFARLFDGLASRGNVRRFVDCCDLVTRVPPEAFTAEKIGELLGGLITNRVARAVLPIAASALADALRALHIDAEYVHVGAELYRDRAGKALPAGTTVDGDQGAARRAYRGRLVPGPKELLDALRGAVASAAEAEGLRDALRTFATTLFQGGRVPLRDLADHAPINYVSVFSGRIPPTTGQSKSVPPIV